MKQLLSAVTIFCALAVFSAQAGTAPQGFVAPFAVAAGSHGRAYVADPGAQTIFTWNNGTISVLAGPGPGRRESATVRGGFRNGPANQARFNGPLALAVAADGSVLVADSGNHCIRRIKNGIVTTVAGDPRRVTPRDGSPGQAGFAMPVGLAVDGNDIYVADYGGGVRLINTHGDVSSPSIPGMTRFVRSLSYAQDGKHKCLYIVNLDHGVFSLYDYFLDSKERDNLGEVTGGAIGGSIAALSSTEILLADTASRTVRYWYRNSLGTPFQVGYTYRLTGHDSEDDSGLGGGSRTDALSGSAFQAPTGIAMLSNGRIVVADTAARAVTVLPSLDRRHPVSDDVADLELPSTNYRVAFVSNSFAFHKVSYAESPAQIIEDDLNAKRRPSGLAKPARVVTVMLAPIDLSSTCDYIENYLAYGNFDLVVLMLNGAHIRREFEYHPKLSRDPAIYQPELAAYLAHVNTMVGKAGSRFLVALQPEAEEASLLEHGWMHDVEDSDLEKFYATQRRENLRIVDLAGVDVADTYPVFAGAERSANRVPLFGTYDAHLSRAGVRLIAHAIANAIIARRPWSKPADGTRP